MTAFVIQSLSLSARFILMWMKVTAWISEIVKNVIKIILNSIYIGRGYTVIRGELLGKSPGNFLIY